MNGRESNFTNTVSMQRQILPCNHQPQVIYSIMYGRNWKPGYLTKCMDFKLIMTRHSDPPL